jgi:tripartite-type tricarboxylate transporter receptor subunit TctC
MGTEPAGSTPEALAQQLIHDVDTWAKVVKQAGITAN